MSRIKGPRDVEYRSSVAAHASKAATCSLGDTSLTTRVSDPAPAGRHPRANFTTAGPNGASPAAARSSASSPGVTTSWSR